MPAQPGSSADTSTPDVATSSDNVASNIKVFIPPTGTSSITPNTLPDAYFEPTAGEAHKAHQGLVDSRVDKYESPLMTRRLRDEDSAKKAQVRKNRFPTSTIRIRFANQTLLQGTIPSAKTITAVYDFVRQSLSEPAKSCPFFLFHAPPRTEYKETDPSISKTSLLDLQLIPSAVLYIKFGDEKFNDSKNSPPLRDDLLSLIEELPNPSITEDDKPDESSKSEKSNNATKKGSSGNVPKWLKKAINK